MLNVNRAGGGAEVLGPTSSRVEAGGYYLTTGRKMGREGATGCRTSTSLCCFRATAGKALVGIYAVYNFTRFSYKARHRRIGRLRPCGLIDIELPLSGTRERPRPLNYITVAGGDCSCPLSASPILGVFLPASSVPAPSQIFPRPTEDIQQEAADARFPASPFRVLFSFFFFLVGCRAVSGLSTESSQCLERRLREARIHWASSIFMWSIESSPSISSFASELPSVSCS
ncbi:hypothetical protein VUR80DRAFT_9637 [Thermomyces stellatus]